MKTVDLVKQLLDHHNRGFRDTDFALLELWHSFEHKAGFDMDFEEAVPHMDFEQQGGKRNKDLVEEACSHRMERRSDSGMTGTSTPQGIEQY